MTTERIGLIGFWFRYLVCLLLPLNSLIFLVTGPHIWYEALFFTIPPMILAKLDSRASSDGGDLTATQPAWPFDLIVYLACILQFLIILNIGLLFSEQNFFSIDTAVALLIIGRSSNLAIATAHELIHKHGVLKPLLGRLMLVTVCYEHFFTEHLRGHHANVGTAKDGATARFGESFTEYFKRSVPQQFKSAWNLEKERIGLGPKDNFSLRQLENRVLQGLFAQLCLAVCMLALFGWGALAVFLIQAYRAIRSLEVVNYMEHWGIERKGKRVRLEDSWDTHAWVSRFGLLGLSRHADHHVYPKRPYQLLRLSPQAPITPKGYLAEAERDYQESAAIELGRKGLGPFYGKPVGREEALEKLREVHEAKAGEQRSRWKLPSLNFLLRAVLIVTLTALAVQWETGGEAMGYLSRMGLHTWILLIYIISFRLSNRVAGNRPFQPVIQYGILLGLVGLSTSLEFYPLSM